MQNKKVLFVCQYFYPETFRGNDVSFHLSHEGHDVHVVTGTPNYPAGKFYDGYGIFKKRHEVINGVRVTHLPIFPRGNNKIMLMLNYFSYWIVAWIYILFHAIWHKYDMVFCQQLSPVMMSGPAVLYKKLRHVPLYIWVLDLWPESLTAAGGINNKYILRFFKNFVASEYRYSDKILISSRSFVESIREYGNYEGKIIYYPQWSDETSSTAKNFEMPDIPDGFKVMFAGAVGEAHGFECNMQAALLTKEHKEIKWIIVGDGRKLDWVKQFVKDNGLEDTVYTLGRFPSNTMSLFFEKADVMLVSLTDSPLFNLYAPAKISSYMASGRPIITCLNGEGSEVVNEANCGWNVKAGDAAGLARLVIELSQTINLY
ncbi:capsular polysaccharide biosynthesis protein Cps4F [Bacteroides intestinalis CAG:315]|uniref:glycosyltransferase family 4 protein n=1 Tax=Bacteroides intestinalis TaxID=329854 RepID=UPI00033E57AC|nr:glycosyltransferase family 4 protein [Bacteroides intestinalis]CDD97619.1 capsular polysaccharide biosynthesis protein Cps4F [Bacteroides intestinalis CAG:315]